MRRAERNPEMANIFDDGMKEARKAFCDLSEMGVRVSRPRRYQEGLIRKAHFEDNQKATLITDAMVEAALHVWFYPKSVLITSQARTDMRRALEAAEKARDDDLEGKED
jgi:hypothetical protein